MFLEVSQNSLENTCARVSLLIKLQVSDFFTLNKFFTKSLADKKLCGGVVAPKVPIKLICYSRFCIVVGCKTQISVVLDNSPGDLLEKFKENNLAKVSLLKLLTTENLLVCFH